MKKKLFYLCYTPAVLSLGILYCFLYRTGVSNQTGFYVGDNFLLPVFYLSGLFLLAGLYLWSVRSAAKSEGTSAEGNSFLWGVSSILCGVLLLLRALNEVRQLAEPFLGQESVPVKNIILPGLDGILSLAAALSSSTAALKKTARSRRCLKPGKRNCRTWCISSCSHKGDRKGVFHV